MQKKHWKKQDEKGNKTFIAGVMFPNIHCFDYDILSPKDNLFRTGGYRLLPENIPTYSPIDLSVFYFETYPKQINETIDLRKWFKENQYRECEDIIHIAIWMKNDLQVKSISQWKYFLFTSEHALLSEIKLILRNNAPFTFQF